MKRIIKSFVLAPFIICVFNRMAIVLDFFIPLNIGAIVIVGLLGIPGLVMMICIYFYFF